MQKYKYLIWLFIMNLKFFVILFFNIFKIWFAKITQNFKNIIYMIILKYIIYIKILKIYMILQICKIHDKKYYNLYNLL